MFFYKTLHKKAKTNSLIKFDIKILINVLFNILCRTTRKQKPNLCRTLYIIYKALCRTFVKERHRMMPHCVAHLEKRGTKINFAESQKPLSYSRRSICSIEKDCEIQTKNNEERYITIQYNYIFYIDIHKNPIFIGGEI